MVTIVRVVPSVTWGEPLQFRFRAEPAPAADLTVGVTIASSGCKLAQSSTSVTIAAGAPAATLVLPTTGAEVGEQGCAVTATVAAGEGYAVGSDGSSRSAAVAITGGAAPGAPPIVAGDALSAGVPPRVTIDTIPPYVTAGDDLRLTLSADPPPANDFQVQLLWTDPEGVLVRGFTTVWIRTSGKGDDTLVATRANASFGDDNIAQVYVTFAAFPWYTFDNTTRGTLVLGRALSRSLVSIVANPLSVDEGDDVAFTVTADPPPARPLTVRLFWRNRGRFVQNPPPTVTIPTVGNMSFTLATKDDLIDNSSNLVGVFVDKGTRNGIGWPATATVSVVDDDFTSVVSIVADSTEVVEGNDLSFTLTADPPPASNLKINLDWTVKGYLYGSRKRPHELGVTPPKTATIPAEGATKGTATVTVPIIDDDIYTYPTTVTVRLLAGNLYFARGAASRASITIRDDD